MTTGDASVDRCVEEFCEQGCGSVRDYIRALREGQPLPQFEGLDAAQRRLLQRELEAIMGVYDEPPGDT
ncbi:MAG: hypothetical protein WCY26_04960 [Thiohalobacteraceae bacterium]